MIRDLTSGMITEIAKSSVSPVFFVQIDSDSGLLHFWSGTQDISWNGSTWTGVGNLLGIQPSAEVTSLTAEGYTLSLNGCLPGLVGLALAHIQNGKTAKVWIGFLDSTGTIIADPYNMFVGFTDIPTIKFGGDSTDISLTVESELIALTRPSPRRYTAADIQIDYPGDKGFDYVPAIQTWNEQWGGAQSLIGSAKVRPWYVAPPPPDQGAQWT